ncbi:MAG: efflux RND transporter permease subunit [Paludibaculum sp.]
MAEYAHRLDLDPAFDPLLDLTVLSLMGQTINVMTLGGLALAVGILVDDATVEIENTHRNLGMKKPLTRAVLDGAMQIAAPTFVSTLSICVVFVPVLLLTGVAKFLFTPLALAVVFAMMASYLLSRTLVPTMVHYLLGQEAHLYQHGEHATGGKGIIWSIHHAFNRRFESFRERYTGFLDWALDHKKAVGAAFAVFVVLSLALAPMVGRDFFPSIDSGQMRLHARAPSGTRMEQTELRLRRHRRRDPRGDSAAGTRHHRRQHRAPEWRFQPGLRRQPHHRNQRRRDSHLPESGEA